MLNKSGVLILEVHVSNVLSKLGLTLSQTTKLNSSKLKDFADDIFFKLMKMADRSPEW